MGVERRIGGEGIQKLDHLENTGMIESSERHCSTLPCRKWLNCSTLQDAFPTAEASIMQSCATRG